MKFAPVLTFKEIADNTSEKEKEKKLEDRSRWTQFFNAIVADYFLGIDLKAYHRDFIPGRDRLDCYVPASGVFNCGGRVVGKRKGKKKKKKDWENNEAAKVKMQESQKGCGRNWNSDRTLVKFVCFINENEMKGGHCKLLVDLREFGQRCGHCTMHYENPSFNDTCIRAMLNWLLYTILEAIFNIVDNSIEINLDDLKIHSSRRRPRRKIVANGEGERKGFEGNHDTINCEACEYGKPCGIHRSKIKRKKNKNKNAAPVNTSNNTLP